MNLSQLVASIVSSYTTTTVRELNDDSYSFYLDDLATDLYNSFHRLLHHSSSVIIVYLDSSHVKNDVIMWVLSSVVTIMMLVDRFMRRGRVRGSGDDGEDYFWWRWRLVSWWRCRFSQWWRRWLARLMRSLVNWYRQLRLNKKRKSVASRVSFCAIRLFWLCVNWSVVVRSIFKYMRWTHFNILDWCDLF
jgi:hypothetical protein